MTRFNAEAKEAVVAKAAEALTEGDKTGYHQAMRCIGNVTVSEQADLVRAVQVRVTEIQADQ
jgi:hypothetical protein